MYNVHLNVSLCLCMSIFYSKNWCVDMIKSQNIIPKQQKYLRHKCYQHVNNKKLHVEKDKGMGVQRNTFISRHWLCAFIIAQ